MNAKTLLARARAEMKPKEISTVDWHTDLYLKVTPISTALIDQYDWKENVTKFRDQINHELWYEVPFGNTDVWEKRGCPCGKVEA